MLFSSLHQAARIRTSMAFRRQRRFNFFSTTTGNGSNHAFVTAKRKLTNESFYATNWFSDPSTYPLMVTMATAVFLVTGVGASCILYNPDVQINPQTRGSVLRPEQL